MHVLQKTLFPKPGFPKALYLRQRSGQAARALGMPTDSEGEQHIDLELNETLSTDTFLGSFYLSYWMLHTNVTDISVVVGFRGGGTVRVMDGSGTDAVQLCEYELESSGPKRFLIQFPSARLHPGLNARLAPGRLYVEITANRASAVYAIEFVTPEAPLKDVRLDFGITTKNFGESQLSELLPPLARMADNDAAFAAIDVVNYGPAPADSNMIAGLGSGSLRFINPDDLTDARGLFPTLRRAIEKPGLSTHHVVMSDDIVVDERLFERAVAFLQYAKGSLILCPVVFDAQRPTVIHQAGYTLSAGGRFQPRGHGESMVLAKNSELFATAKSIDYAPWWLCILPLDAESSALAHDAPLLRGDDFAIQRDMAGQGVPTVCLPGFAIWRNAATSIPVVESSAKPYDLTSHYVPLCRAPEVEFGEKTDADRSKRGSVCLNVIQPSLFPQDKFPEDLYLRLAPPRPRGGLVPVLSSSGKPAIRLDKGDVLSTDTFFGSFYRAYWQSYTSVRDIAVTVDFVGACKIRVFEDTGRGAVQLAEEESQSDRLRRILVEFQARDIRPDFSQTDLRPSRLFVTIEALAESDISAIDFVTFNEPLRQTTLSIGLCTFNQEAYFATTIKKVASLAARTDAIRAVHVINQGAPFSSPEIRSQLSLPKIKLVDQRNLGGCGGFTRSLTEELAAKSPASHHLMMDDDIVLDERMILRAMRFLDYASKEMALGAGMIDGLRPTVMYEAGAFLHTSNSIHPYCHNVDLSGTDQLWHFNTPVKTDFNAWWFCILPVERAREVSLPAPVFIRGDDFEYGQRLAKAGVPTVTLPGIGIWHEPFYAKSSGWQDYYDLRNRLIFGATYSEKVRQLPLLEILRIVASSILTHNYMAAELRLMAISDFLKGPDRLFASDPEAIHKAVMAKAKKFAPERLDNSWKTQPLSGGKPPPVTTSQIVKSLIYSALRTANWWTRNDDRILMDTLVHPGNTAGQRYIVTNGPRTYHIRFSPRRFKMWTMLVRTAIIGGRYQMRWAAAGKKWTNGVKAYCDPDWWANVFQRPSATADPLPDNSKRSLP
jgi:galactofuranosylgalactofuranosylrhamnosyl-N-acetylglucosaminyl-diphospho-decaprenol beta-1,5/1,6-galactofuranosyltransferase